MSAAALKRVKVIAMIVAALALSAATVLPDGVPAAKRGAEQLRLVTANVYHSNRAPEDVGVVLARIVPDVVMVLEWRGDNADLAPLRRIGLELIVEDHRSGMGGIAVLARRGLVQDAAIVASPVDGPCANPIATLRLIHRGAELNVLGIHAPPPVAVCEQTNTPTLEAVAAWFEGGKINASVGAAAAGLPTVVAGDLNAFPFWPGLRALRRAGLADTYARARWGLGPTWPARGITPPFARIDYVLVPEWFDIGDSWSLTLPGSDHRAVVSDFTP